MKVIRIISPWAATPRQRLRLAGQPKPVLDPALQDYAAWRLWSLRWAVIAVFASYGLGFYAGETFNTLKLDVETRSWLKSILELGVTWYLRAMATAGMVMLLAAIWYWHNLDRSRRLSRLAWALAFLGPLPIFLIPFTWVLDLHGIQAAGLSSKIALSLVTFYISALIALLPASIRASLVLHRFLPSTVLPGALLIGGTALYALTYFVAICVILQLSPHWKLLTGLFFLMLSPIAYWPRARARLQSSQGSTRHWPMILEAIFSRLFMLLGCGLILYDISNAVNLRELLGPIFNIWWVLGFMAGVMANRAFLTVILVDALFQLHRLHSDCGYR
jgi:hypothetical protein